MGHKEKHSPIGGFLGLELGTHNPYHNDAIALNSGRAAFEFILRQGKFKKIYIPIFTCEAIEQTVIKTGINYEKYYLNKDMEPILDANQLASGDALLYTNYFGIKTAAVRRLAGSWPNLIIDNAQAFFDTPIVSESTFYSPRKFFGIPDGGYVYVDKTKELDLAQDASYGRFDHLLRRLEESAEDVLELYRNNEKKLSLESMKTMSIITEKLLKSIDYAAVKKVRKNNFEQLHASLVQVNEIYIEDEKDLTPLTYPLLIDDDQIRNRLLENQIFTPIYWPNVVNECPKDGLEYAFAKKIIHLPIDQRYSEVEMSRILGVILK